MRPTTTVQTTRPEVGILVDAPVNQVSLIANELAANGIHASFALARPPAAGVPRTVGAGDQAIPLLPTGGLVRWLGTRDQLHDVLHAMGFGHRFLYASNGPSVGQWWLAHGAGGHLVAGAIHMEDGDATPGPLHPGEVIELTLAPTTDVQLLVQRLHDQLLADHLSAVSLGRLMRDARVPV